MGVEENKQNVRRFMEAMEEGDLDTVKTLVNLEEFQAWTAGDLPFSGQRGFDVMINQSVEMLYPHFPEGIKFIQKEMTAEGNRVAWELESDAKHWTGATYHNYYHFLWVFDDDGKIVLFKEYLDTAHAGDILGRDKPNLPPA